MLILPSGRVIDLSTDRAKYHALRCPGVGPASEHRAFHALVDVLYRYRDSTGTPCAGQTEYDFEFSGYTLDSVRTAVDWQEADKAALEHWIGQEEQRRYIETARRRLADNQQQLSITPDPAPRRLFSLLQQRLRALGQTHASTAQWSATLRNMMRQGVRAEELHWSGIQAYLRQHPPQVLLTKAQLLQHIAFNHVRLELWTEQIRGADGGLTFHEHACRMPHQGVYRATLKLDADCLCIQRYVDHHYNYRIGVVKAVHRDHPMALNKYWFVFDPYGRAVPNPEATGIRQPFFSNSLAARRAANRHAHEQFDICSDIRNHSRYEHLTLFGGHDYREWLICLPDHQRVFFGSHFYDHNILAHIRTTTRIDHAGRKLLFIEEIQSDWHQAGGRHGYDSSWWGQVADAPFKKEWPALAAKLMVIHASANGYSGIAWPPGHIQEARYQRPLAAIKHYYDRALPRALNRLGRSFQCRVATTLITTRDPWLKMERRQDKWRVADGQGKFQTKAKYRSRDEAMAVIARHCRATNLSVPVFYISAALHRQIAGPGLPLFGESF